MVAIQLAMLSQAMNVMMETLYNQIDVMKYVGMVLIIICGGVMMETKSQGMVAHLLV